MEIIKPCYEISKKIKMIKFAYQFCGVKHYQDVSFPKIISLEEI